jgi:hypothetical protein
MFPYLSGRLDDFVELAIPALQRRGLFRRDYEGTTVREYLGAFDAIDLADDDELNQEKAILRARQAFCLDISSPHALESCQLPLSITIVSVALIETARTFIG